MLVPSFHPWPQKQNNAYIWLSLSTECVCVNSENYGPYLSVNSNCKQWLLIADVGSKWSSTGLFLRAATPKRSLLLKNINEYNIKYLPLKWMRSDKFKMSASYEPAIVATSSMNYCFYFPFSFGRSLKGVYEQVNALEVYLNQCTRQQTLTSINQPMPWATTWSNLAFDLYKSFVVIALNQIIYLIQSILRTPNSFSRFNPV